jgi:hypothetical protein
MRNAVGLSALFISSVVYADPKTLLEKAKLADPITVESLTLTPLIAAEADTPVVDDLLTLDETMPKGQVKIVEFNEGDVNNLTFSNKSDHPVFLLAGEVIIGGKQDRIIGQNTVIPAKKTQQVPVFCVEHGRWTGETKEFATAKALAHGRLRTQATFEGQQAVWNEVAAKNVARKTTSGTDTYRAVAQQQASGSMNDWEKKIDSSLEKLSADDAKHLVGFAVSVNGKVATIDLFQSPALFKKLEGKLVRSYITEAVDTKTDKAAKAPVAADIKSFADDAEKAKSENAYDTERASTVMKKGTHAAKSSVNYKRADAPPAAVAPSVYETYEKR